VGNGTIRTIPFGGIMKTSLSALRMMGLSALILFAIGDIYGQQKKEPVNRKPASAPVRPRPGLVKSGQSRQSSARTGGRNMKFDHRRFDRQIEVLKKISTEHETMQSVVRAMEQARPHQLAAKARAIQKNQQLKLFGKPTVFRKAPFTPEPSRKQSLAKTLVSNVLVNGKSQDTVTVGAPLTFTFSFSASAVSAVAGFYIDADQDGVRSAGDAPVFTNVLLMDNDDTDEDLTEGQYQLTFRGDETLNHIVAPLLFEVNDYQSVSSALVVVQQETSATMVIGTVDPPQPFVLISVWNLGYFFTDSTGTFEIAADGLQGTNLELAAFDFLGNENGYIVSIFSKNITVGPETTFVHWSFPAATEFVEGYATDQYGSAVPDVIVAAATPESYVQTRTGADGYFNLGVVDGWTSLTYDVPSNEYMRSFPSWGLEVPAHQTVQHDITLLKANSSIGGAIQLGTVGLGGVPIEVYADSLFNFALSTGDGSYSVPVYDPLVESFSYVVETYVPGGYFLSTPYYYGIEPGATNVDFSVVKVAGGINGRITDINTGEGIADAYISVYGPSSNSTYSNDSGYYHMSLIDGTYTVSVSADLYYSYYGQAIISGNQVTFDVALDRSGSFSGTVSNDQGGIMRDVLVLAHNESGYVYGYGFSDAQGHYVVGGLPTGNYKASISKNGYLMQWYDDASVADSASVIAVTDGFDTPGIDFHLSKGGSISGRVVDHEGRPVGNVFIDVFDSLYNQRSYSTTDDSGYYAATGLTTGSYIVRATSEFYFDQWYDGASSYYNATPVNVTTNEETPEINFTLLMGGSISGTVNNKSSAAIEGAFITVLDSADNYYYPVAYGYTDQSGAYVVHRLQPQHNLYVMADADGYAWRWYDNVSSPDSATAIVLSEQELREHIDFTLPVAASISGTVLDDLGAPIPYAGIYAEDGTTSYYTQTDNQGLYKLGNLPAGTFYVEAYTYSGYFRFQWFDHKSSRELADPVTVLEEQNTPNIDFDIQRPAGIGGTIVNNADDIGINDAMIQFIPKSGGYVYSVHTDYTGSYFLSLPAGTYLIRASDSYYNEFLPQYYSSAGTTFLEEKATEVTIADTDLPKEIHFRLNRSIRYFPFSKERLGMTMTNFGALGYPQDTTLASGRWPRPTSRNHLYLGSIVIGANKYNPMYGDRISVSGNLYSNEWGEWMALSNYAETSGLRSRTVETWFEDRNDLSMDNLKGLIVRETGFAWQDSNYAVYKFTVFYRPPAYLPSEYTRRLEDAYIGFFMDFDMTEAGAGDLVGIDRAANLAYMYDAAAPGGVNMGVRLLTGTAAHVTWWKNMNDPMMDTDLYDIMANDTVTTLPTDPGDYRVFISAGPFDFRVGDSTTISIAIVAGVGEEEMKRSAQMITATELSQSVQSQHNDCI